MSTDLAPFGFHHVSCHRFFQFRCIGNLPFPDIDKPMSDAFGQVASFRSLALCCLLRRQEICGRIEQPRDIFLLAFLLFLFCLVRFSARRYSFSTICDISLVSFFALLALCVMPSLFDPCCFSSRSRWICPLLSSLVSLPFSFWISVRR